MPDVFDYAAADMRAPGKFLLNSDTLKVHKADAPCTKRRSGTGWWFSEWEPPGDRYDTACRRCFPDGKLPNG